MAVDYVIKDKVAYITLNRPEVDNLIDHQVAGELVEIASQINQDDNVYVAVLTGSGKTFSTGGEVEKLAVAGTGLEKTKLLEAVTHAANALASIDRPVIAVINGDALGQGLELALACDIRLASEKARFGFPHTALGIIPVDGGTQRLPRIVGRGKALELIFTAEIISAREAFEIGLVSKVVPEETLSLEAESLALMIANKAPISLRFIKEAVNKGLDLTLEQGLRLEGDLYFLLHTTADRTEGIRAFLGKRPPQFKGN